MRTTNIMIAAAASAVICSCSFLDLEPKVMTDTNFYRTEQNVRYGLAGVYGILNSEETYGHYWSLQVSNADDLCYYSNYNNSESRVDKYNFDANNSVVYSVWTALYKGIKNANNFLVSMDSRLLMDPKDLSTPLSQYKAEARFLRAYYHFMLAQAWGAVPLYDKPATSPNPSDVQIAATPQKDVLKWVADEMEACLPELTESVDGTPDRICRTTAQGILARVYMFMAGESVDEIEGLSKHELWGKAAQNAKAVIDSKLHRLNPSYSQVFINMMSDQYDTQYHESMWEADFLGDRTSGDKWTNGRIGDLIGLKSVSGSTNYSEWACNYSYGYYNGSYRLWQLYWTIDRTSAEADDMTAITDARQLWNLPPYNYAGSNKKISYNFGGEKYEQRVFSVKASMAKAPFNYQNYFSMPAEEITGQDLTVENSLNPEHILYDPTVQAAVRNAGKWRRETIYEPQMKAKSLYTTINFPILRYSDVLLMYAEAQNEYAGAPDGLAKECVLAVRQRAGISTDEALLADHGLFQTLVRNERGRELAFEGLRKWDLIRWGIFVDEMHNAGNEFPSDNRLRNATVCDYASVNYSNVSPKHIALPIPTKELAVNHALRQNPLW